MSALWILVANGWMQNPVGAAFNFETMRMELVDFGALIFNPVAQVKFVHTVSAGYVTGAIFVLAISSYYLLKKRDLPFARRSFAIAAIFGLASTLSVILLGDESGYELGDVQKLNSLQLKPNGILILLLLRLLCLVYQTMKKCEQIMQLKFHTH